MTPSEMAELGVKYYHGDNVQKDYAEAVWWLYKAAEQGNPCAQGYLGYCYRFAKGLNKDNEKAFNWFSKAAQSSLAMVQCNYWYVLLCRRSSRARLCRSCQMVS
jgi:TPR repeat protein